MHAFSSSSWFLWFLRVPRFPWFPHCSFGFPDSSGSLSSSSTSLGSPLVPPVPLVPGFPLVPLNPQVPHVSQRQFPWYPGPLGFWFHLVPMVSFWFSPGYFRSLIFPTSPGLPPIPLRFPLVSLGSPGFSISSCSLGTLSLVPWFPSSSPLGSLWFFQFPWFLLFSLVLPWFLVPCFPWFSWFPCFPLFLRFPWWFTSYLSGSPCSIGSLCCTLVPCSPWPPSFLSSFWFLPLPLVTFVPRTSSGSLGSLPLVFLCSSGFLGSSNSYWFSDSPGFFWFLQFLLVA